MSGRVIFERDAATDAPGAFHHAVGRLPAHDHAVFALEGGARLTLNDPRRFGFLLAAPSTELVTHPALATLGIEPLGNLFSGASLKDALAGSRAPLKSALLDQRRIAGLGNIYVCEALHRARLSPFRAAGSLIAEEAEELAGAIRAVLEDALAAGGSTLRDFRHEDGALGYFQHAFRVYDRNGAACPTPRCSGTVERQVQAGRSTFYCARCQR